MYRIAMWTRFLFVCFVLLWKLINFLRLYKTFNLGKNIIVATDQHKNSKSRLLHQIYEAVKFGKLFCLE